MSNIHINPPLCITAGSILLPVGAGMVALRIYSRKTQHVSLGLDDWLVIPALLLFAGMCISLLIGVGEHAVGYRTPPPTPGATPLTTTSWKQRQTKLIYWTIELMQIPMLTALKLSFILFYKRLFAAGAKKWYRWSLWLMIVTIGLWGVAYFFAFIFVCRGTPQNYWISLETEKKYCTNSLVLHNSYGTTDFILDVIIFVLPLPPVLQLRMPVKKRLGLIAIFSLGAGSVVASCIRMVTYWTSTAVEFNVNSDLDILLTGAAYWSVLECGIGLICCCLPSCSWIIYKKRRDTMIATGTKRYSVNATNSRRLTRDPIAGRILQSRSFVNDTSFKLDSLSQSSSS